jgi:hypothetical protein
MPRRFLQAVMLETVLKQYTVETSLIVFIDVAVFVTVLGVTENRSRGSLALAIAIKAKMKANDNDFMLKSKTN